MSLISFSPALFSFSLLDVLLEILRGDVPPGTAVTRETATVQRAGMDAHINNAIALLSWVGNIVYIYALLCLQTRFLQ